MRRAVYRALGRCERADCRRSEWDAGLQGRGGRPQGSSGFKFWAQLLKSTEQRSLVATQRWEQLALDACRSNSGPAMLIPRTAG